MGRVLGFAKAGSSKSQWRDKANRLLDMFPEAAAPKIHGWVLPHSEAVPAGTDGIKAYHEECALAGQPPISIAAFLISAKFWSSTLQTWQAEYLVIAVFVAPKRKVAAAARHEPSEIV
jgi:hypothetical protein